MISHVHLGVRDFPRALAFYDPLLVRLGWRLRFVDAALPRAAWQPPSSGRPLFVIGVPYDGRPATPGNGDMVALLAPDRAAVADFHAAALAAGAACEGPPGLRPQYHPHFFGAYVRDPDGHKLCVCCHDPA
ncbi:VOC family protein [Phenylobacterium sp.]|uniref:VOC family protein n=1 Tax=Phenylobacterium sp. TaxID=1871053 RepID=UPI0025EC192E|nr:VOC family protein [Phenylobacterium sp.]